MNLDTLTTESRLYSPPQFHKRLPKQEPRPHKVKSMTVAAGFQCSDGVLLVADSKHNAGDSSYLGPKLWEIQCGEFRSSLVVTGAGIDSAIIEAVNSLKNDEGIRGKSITFEVIESAIKLCAMGKDSTLLIGVKVHSEERARLLRAEEDDQGKVRITPISYTSEPPCTFTGTTPAQVLCREIFRSLHDPNVPILAMKELAKHVLGRVFEYDHFCGPPVQIGYLFNADGQNEMIDDFRLPEYTSGYYGYLCGVQHLLGQTIRHCVDFTAKSDADFEHSLKQLTDELRAMRENSKGSWIVTG